MKHTITQVGFGTFVFVLCVSGAFKVNATTWPSIIDSHGKAIASVFSETKSNLRKAEIYSAILNSGPRQEPSCSLLKTVLRDKDGTKPRLLYVSACQGHYQVDSFRTCGSYCNGGTEDWTYSDSDISDWCTGSQLDNTGCNTGNCSEEYTCYNNSEPTCN